MRHGELKIRKLLKPNRTDLVSRAGLEPATLCLKVVEVVSNGVLRKGTECSEVIEILDFSRWAETA